MIATALSGPPSSSHNAPSFLENQHVMDASKRSANGVPLASAFQPLDSTSPPAPPPFHHPQPLYTDSMSSSSNSSSSRDPYHHQSPSPTSHQLQQHQHYLANPLSVGSGNTNLLNDSANSPTSDLSPDNNNNNNKDSRGMGHCIARNNSHPRHHPYANSHLPPKPTLHHHHYTSPYANNNSVMLKKPPSSRRLHHSSSASSASPSKSLVKEIGNLSVKTEPDYLGRPW